MLCIEVTMHPTRRGQTNHLRLRPVPVTLVASLWLDRNATRAMQTAATGHSYWHGVQPSTDARTFSKSRMLSEHPTNTCSNAATNEHDLISTAPHSYTALSLLHPCPQRRYTPQYPHSFCSAPARTNMQSPSSSLSSLYPRARDKKRRKRPETIHARNRI